MTKTKKDTAYRIFTSIPPHYDLVNHIMTLGMDSSWRRAAVDAILRDNPGNFLDLCCGTADLAIQTAGRTKFNIDIAGLDFSRPMLEKAKLKVAASRTSLTLIHGDAANLPFPDNHFDRVAISFAFRSMFFHNPAAPRYLSEILRVLKPGGRFIVVETSQPQNGIIRAGFHLFMRLFAYPAGALISGDKAAYKWLADSTRTFYSPAEMKKLLIEAGFSSVSYRALFLGAAGIHTAVK